MSVARILGPQLLDATVGTIQVPVNQERVGVGADLGRDPDCQSHQRGSQRLAQTEYPFQAGEGDLYVLPHSAPPLRWLGRQEDIYLGQGYPQLFATVGEISEHPACHLLSQFRLLQQLFSQGDIRYVCRRKLVGDGHPVCGTQHMQLHAVDRKGAPPYPRSSRRGIPPACRLRNLARMQNLQQSGVYEQGLRISYELGDDLSPQELQVAPEFPHPPVQRRRMQPYHARKQVREEPLSVAQEGALGLHPSQLLEECKRDHLRVREALYGLVELSTGVEQRVSVVHEAEKDAQSFFQIGKRVGMLVLGHLLLLVVGRL